MANYDPARHLLKIAEAHLGSPLTREMIRPLAYTEDFALMVTLSYGNAELDTLRRAWGVLVNATEGT